MSVDNQGCNGEGILIGLLNRHNQMSVDPAVSPKF